MAFVCDSGWRRRAREQEHFDRLPSPAEGRILDQPCGAPHRPTLDKAVYNAGWRSVATIKDTRYPELPELDAKEMELERGYGSLLIFLHDFLRIHTPEQTLRTAWIRSNCVHGVLFCEHTTMEHCPKHRAPFSFTLRVNIFGFKNDPVLLS